MAGSLKDFRYTTDTNDVFAISADESNVEATQGVSYDVTTANEAETPFKVPRNVTPRYALYKSTTTTHVRKVPVLTPALYAQLIAKTFTNIEQTFTENIGGNVITFKYDHGVPEKIRAVRSIDTGLNDGDES